MRAGRSRRETLSPLATCCSRSRRTRRRWTSKRRMTVSWPRSLYVGRYVGFRPWLTRTPGPRRFQSSPGRHTDSRHSRARRRPVHPRDTRRREPRAQERGRSAQGVQERACAGTKGGANLCPACQIRCLEESFRRQGLQANLPAIPLRTTLARSQRSAKGGG